MTVTNPLLTNAQACADSMELLRQMLMILQSAINAKLSANTSLTPAQITSLQADYATLKADFIKASANV